MLVSVQDNEHTFGKYHFDVNIFAIENRHIRIEVLFKKNSGTIIFLINFPARINVALNRCSEPGATDPPKPDVVLSAATEINLVPFARPFDFLNCFRTSQIG